MLNKAKAFNELTWIEAWSGCSRIVYLTDRSSSNLACMSHPSPAHSSLTRFPPRKPLFAPARTLWPASVHREAVDMSARVMRSSSPSSLLSCHKSAGAHLLPIFPTLNTLTYIPRYSVSVSILPPVLVLGDAAEARETRTSTESAFRSVIELGVR